MEFTHFLSPILALLMMLLLVPVFRKIAVKIGLVDRPNYRKVHQNPVPLIGGISIFICTSLALFIIRPFTKELDFFFQVFPLLLILITVGVVDDRFDLRAILKLAIQLILAHLVFSQGIKIESFYGLFGVYEIAYWLQYVLTIIIITGVVNAFNLMDGIDGLAGGLSIIGLIILSALAIYLKQYSLFLVFVTYTVALIAFLRFNFSKKNKIFMGDAGSLVIGFLMVVSSIKLLQVAQNSPTISIVAVGVIAVLIIPVFDALRVFRKRLKTGKSPFSADKTHLHHLIIYSGLKHKYASIAIVVLMLVIMGFGYISFHVKGINYALIFMLLIFYIFTQTLQFLNKMALWKKKIKEIEFPS